MRDAIKAPTMPLDARPNRNEQGSHVVRLRFSAVECMEPEVAHRPASAAETIGTARGDDLSSKISQIVVPLGAEILREACWPG